jgi:hypothetical protein
MFYQLFHTKKSTLCRVGSILIVHKNNDLLSILQYEAMIAFRLLEYFRNSMWSVRGLREKTSLLRMSEQSFVHLFQKLLGDGYGNWLCEPG